MSPWKAVSKSSRSTAGNLSTTGIKKKQLNCTFQQNRMDMSIFTSCEAPTVVSYEERWLVAIIDANMLFTSNG
jgi:hypothetical protein